MGVTNLFTLANAELTKHLGYHLDPEHADDFRQLLKRAGYKRFRHAVEVVSLTTRTSDANKTHKRLVDTIWSLIPPKSNPYRNKATQWASGLHTELDRQFYERIRREP